MSPVVGVLLPLAFSLRFPSSFSAYASSRTSCISCQFGPYDDIRDSVGRTGTMFAGGPMPFRDPDGYMGRGGMGGGEFGGMGRGGFGGGYGGGMDRGYGGSVHQRLTSMQRERSERAEGSDYGYSGNGAFTKGTTSKGNGRERYNRRENQRYGGMGGMGGMGGYGMDREMMGGMGRGGMGRGPMGRGPMAGGYGMDREMMGGPMGMGRGPMGRGPMGGFGMDREMMGGPMGRGPMGRGMMGRGANEPWYYEERGRGGRYEMGGRGGMGMDRGYGMGGRGMGMDRGAYPMGQGRGGMRGGGRAREIMERNRDMFQGDRDPSDQVPWRGRGSGSMAGSGYGDRGYGGGGMGGGMGGRGMDGYGSSSYDNYEEPEFRMASESGSGDAGMDAAFKAAGWTGGSSESTSPDNDRSPGLKRNFSKMSTTDFKQSYYRGGA